MIQFQEDHFTYHPQRRGFFLDEPDTLLGDRITPDSPSPNTGCESWQPVTTVKLDENDPLGVIDV